jgi:HD domain
VRLTGVARAVGLRLARDLPAGAGGVPLLQRGATITERYAGALAEHGFRAVWVDDELSTGIEPTELLDEAERPDAARRVRASRDAAQAAARASRPLPSAVVGELARFAGELVDLVDRAPEGGLALHDVAPAAQYVDRHPVNAVATGLLVARAVFRRHGWIDFSGTRRFEQVPERLRVLGLALLLMDIGTVTVPPDVLAKRGPLDARERALVRAHPETGAALLSAPSISPRVVEVVRDHHERMDGGGYPRGLSDGSIPLGAAILAVADAWDVMTTARAYSAPKSAEEALEECRELAGYQFHPEVVEALVMLRDRGELTGPGVLVQPAGAPPQIY